MSGHVIGGRVQGILQRLLRRRPVDVGPEEVSGSLAGESDVIADDAVGSAARGDVVLVAETRYARSVRRSVGRAALVGALLVSMQALLAWMTRIDGSTARSEVSPVTLAVENGVAALLVLLPASIALQVLVRMPRDHENIELEDACAHRQFWGRAAAVVAMASAFIAQSTFVHALVENAQGHRIDVVELFGVPAGAAITLLIAADAATLADLEAERLSLDDSRASITLRNIEAAIARIPGMERPHPKRRLAVQLSLLGVLTIGGGSWLAHVLTGHVGMAVGYAILALMLLPFALHASAQAIPAVLQTKILETVLLLLMPSLLVVVIVLEGAVTAMQVGTGGDVSRYLAGVAYGFLIAAPSVVIVVAFIIPRGERRASPPLFAVARASLNAQAERLRKVAPPADPEPWRVFAWLAIAMFVLPPISVTLATIATCLRREAGDARRGLIGWAWAITALATMLELGALVLLPFYGEALGWFTLQ